MFFGVACLGETQGKRPFCEAVPQVKNPSRRTDSMFVSGDGCNWVSIATATRKGTKTPFRGPQNCVLVPFGIA